MLFDLETRTAFLYMTCSFLVILFVQALGKKLGKGAYGVVYKAIHQTQVLPSLFSRLTVLDYHVD